MRHGKKFNHLSRKAPHRASMLSNMASSLIFNKRISTTVAKAKELRKYVEPIITKAKDDSTHSRRVIFSYLGNKRSVKELFDEVANKVGDRPGGYTRILKTGNRIGDNADMCIIELVDYNELLLEQKETKKSKTRRSRRRGKSGGAMAVAEEQVGEQPASGTKADMTVTDDEAVAQQDATEQQVTSETTTPETNTDAVAEANVITENTFEESTSVEDPESEQENSTSEEKKSEDQ